VWPILLALRISFGEPALPGCLAILVPACEDYLRALRLANDLATDPRE
jgi:hypothetical protein